MRSCFHPNKNNTPHEYFVDVSQCPKHLIILYKNSIKYVSTFIFCKKYTSLQRLVHFSWGCPLLSVLGVECTHLVEYIR